MAGSRSMDLTQPPVLFLESPFGVGDPPFQLIAYHSECRREQLDPLRWTSLRRCCVDHRKTLRGARAKLVPKKQLQALAYRARAGGEHLHDEIAIHLGVFRRHQWRSALTQPEHHHLHTRHWHEIVSIEFVHNRCLKPGKCQRRDKRAAWNSEESFRRFPLHHQVRVIRRVFRASESIDDAGGHIKWDVGEDFVAARWQGHVQEIALSDLDVRCSSKPRSQVARQTWILLYSDHPAAPIGQAVCHDARPRAKIKYQFAGLNA
jgi:hypothetical protein